MPLAYGHTYNTTRRRLLGRGAPCAPPDGECHIFLTSAAGLLTAARRGHMLATPTDNLGPPELALAPWVPGPVSLPNFRAGGADRPPL